jgi:hypothetical protein
MSKTTGGIYRFQCGDHCGQPAFEHFCWHDDVEIQSCPRCGSAAHRIMPDVKQNGTDFAQPMLSRALGVPPDQIAEAQAAFPHHKFTPDGRMQIDSYEEHKRVLKDLGFTEY